MREVGKLLESVLAVLLIISVHNCESKGSSRNIHDAAIYPGSKRTALKLSYSDSVDFSNFLEAMKDEGFLSLGLFCVKRGAFILYQATEFNIRDAEGFRIASGENRCFKPSGLLSAQPIGSISFPMADSITFYNKPNFASMSLPTIGNVGINFFTTLHGSVKSLILIGRQNWTITTRRGRKFCVMVDFDPTEKHPICVLPSFTLTKIGRPDILLKWVKKGCKPEQIGENIISINFCHYWGSVPNVTTESALTFDEEAKGIEGRSMGSSSCSSDDKMKETLKLLKGVITGSNDDSVILGWRDMGNSRWKLELLDTVFDVAKLAIPSDLVTENYMNKLRELFVFQLSLAWQRDKQEGGIALEPSHLIGKLTEYDYRNMIYQVTQCATLMTAEAAKAQKENKVAWYGLKDPAKKEDLVWTSLRRKKDDNVVLEMTWVVANMVGGICHRLFGYIHNFWAMYIHLMKEMYLKPVVPEWKKNIENLDILLGGDVDTQYTKLALFASLHLFQANNLEPFQRPQSSKT